MDDLLALDLETSNLRPEQGDILAVGLSSASGTTAGPVDRPEDLNALERILRNAMGLPGPERAVQRLEDAVRSPRPLAVHDVRMEGTWSESWFGVRLAGSRVVDTKLLANRVHPGQPANLAALTSMYLPEVSGYKAETDGLIKAGRAEDVPQEDLLRRVAVDAWATYRLAGILLPKVPELARAWLAEDVDLALCVERMAQRGLLLDEEEALKLKEESLRTQEALLAKYRPVNLGSSEQVGELLVGLGCRLRRSTAGNLGVDEAVLRGLAHESTDQRVRDLCGDVLRYRGAQKLRTTYAEGYAKRRSADGRVRSDLRFPGAVSWRLASSDPNLQNVPPGVRSLYRARPGHVLLEADYCLSPETRVLTRDLRWLTAGSLQVGDELVGFDEKLDGRKTKLKPSTVLSAKRLKRPGVAIDTDRGTLTCSADHLWVVRSPAADARGRRWERAINLRPGDEIAYLCDPWVEDASRDGGWMAGIFDGEGTVAAHGGHNVGKFVSFGQKPGVVLDKALEIIRRNGLDAGVHTNKKSGVANVYLKGGGRPAMRALGIFRPTRLMLKSDETWVGTSTWSSGTRASKVRSVRCVGEIEVVALGTSTKTLVADGHLSHNCQAELRIAAAVAPEPALIALFRAGADPHALLAGRIFGSGYTKDQRHHAKTTNFSLLYDGTEYTLMDKFQEQEIFLSFADASVYKTAFHREYQGFGAWTRRTREELLAGKTVYSPTAGYAWCLEDALRLKQGNTEEALKAVKNWTIQAIPPRWALRAAYKAEREGLEVVLNTHDGLLLEVPETDKVEAGNRISELMAEVAAETWMGDVPVPADVKAGTSWGSMKPLGGE